MMVHNNRLPIPVKTSQPIWLIHELDAQTHGLGILETIISFGVIRPDKTAGFKAM